MKSHQISIRIIGFLVLTVVIGLGLALALPCLANAQSLAAEGKPDRPPDFAELIHSTVRTYAFAVEGNGFVENQQGPCFATHNDGTDVFDSMDTSALQKAVDAASSGDTVKVAGACVGVQSHAGLKQTVYISKSLAVEGGHTKNDWSLKPDLDNYPTLLHALNGGRVIVISGTQDVSLDSLYISGGLAEDGTLDNNGGGIWSNSSFSMTNAIIYDNKAESFGGGMYSVGYSSTNSTTILSHVKFSRNNAFSGGGMYNDGSNSGISSPSLSNVAFTGNWATDTGGAMYNNGRDGESSPSLYDCIFSGNSSGSMGGAMMNDGIRGTSSPTLTNVIFLGNSSVYHGGAMHNEGTDKGESSPILTDVTFSGNSTGKNGGAMYNNGFDGTSIPEVINTTFSGNWVHDTDEGAITGWISYPKLFNCILWNNKNKSGTGTINANISYLGGTNYITNSLVQGTGGSSNWILDPNYVNGGGNIDEDPLFITPITPISAPTTTGNLRLGEDSPAIDAGDNTYISGVPTDLDGDPRIVDGKCVGKAIVDMGAYEFQRAICYQQVCPLVVR